MQGVKVERFEDGALFLITELSRSLKESLRRHLTSICHGQSRAQTRRHKYAYPNTIREFLKRYHSKDPATQIGLIGELLTHILLLEHYPNFDCASPLFNMEERSIKKGFDVILYDRNTKALWITEVKCGQLHKDKDESATCSDLLQTAKRDLKGRLNDGNTTIWLNAINGATNFLYGQDKLRDVVNAILEDFGDMAEEGKAISVDKNVLLAAGVFSPLKKGRVTKASVTELHSQIRDEGLFREVLAIVFQKSTCDAVVAFLQEESN